jgi:hypothetical protein
MRTKTNDADRRRALDDLLAGELSALTVALDGPLTRGLKLVRHYRSADALLSQGVFQTRGKPGQTSSPTGQGKAVGVGDAAGGDIMLPPPECWGVARDGDDPWITRALRSREYLRIIYGPKYELPENLERLRSRGLSAKRSLALRQVALGVEGIERFARGEPPAVSMSASSG